MELDPERRFPTPGEMFGEIGPCRSGARTVTPKKGTAAGRNSDREGESRSVMVVESNAEMQDRSAIC